MSASTWEPVFASPEEERRALSALVARHPARTATMPYDRDALIARAQQDLADFADVFDVKGARCLDLGCGRGAMAYVMYLSGADRVWGMDRSAHALEPSFRAGARTQGPAFQRADAVRLPVPDASIDRIAMINALQFLSPLERVFAELGRVLRPGGRVLIRCGPLYYSCDGGHLYNKADVPYLHLLFSRRALRHTLGPLAEHVLQLNRMTRRDLLELIRLHGFHVRSFRESTCERGLDTLASHPELTRRYPREDLLVCNVDCVLEAPPRDYQSG